jgi:hypothetical protein
MGRGRRSFGWKDKASSIRPGSSLLAEHVIRDVGLPQSYPVTAPVEDPGGDLICEAIPQAAYMDFPGGQISTFKVFDL